MSGSSVKLTVRSSPPIVLYDLGSSLYTLATEPPQTAASAQLSASGQVAPPCSCCLLSHQNLLWHHRLSHPSLPRLRGMHSCLLVSGLPRSLPPLPPSPAPPCLPCVEGQQCAAPHSSSFPPTTAPLQTLHMDMTFLHSDRGGEFSSDLFRDFCRGEGILHSFTLPKSPQKNGIAERCIGLVMEFYHPTLRHVFPSQDVTFDESVPFYRLFPYCSAPPTPSPLFLAHGPRPVEPSSPQGPAPSGVSQVDPLSGTLPVKVAGDSGVARGAMSRGAEPGGAEPRGAEPGGAAPRGAESEGAGSGGAELGGAKPKGAEREGVEPRGVECEGAESGGAEPLGAALSGGPASSLPRLSPRPESLSLQQLREWLVWRARLWSGAAGAGAIGDAGDTGGGGAGVIARAGGTGGNAADDPGRARTTGTGAAWTGGVGGAGARDPTEPRAAGGGGTRAGSTGAGGTGARGAGAGGTFAGGAGAGGPRAVDPEGTVRP
ncbi:unnamed protein product [Closterium sp. NIES-53]